MKILVTGGAGFIGSNLALELERQGNEVTIIDNLSSANFKNLLGFKGELILEDVSLFDPFSRFKGERFDLIFHQAGITDTTFGDDRVMIQTNTEGFRRIVEFALKKEIKLIYASSAAVYGNGPVPMREEQALCPLNAYAFSKYLIENTAKRYAREGRIIGLRYFNVYGPGEGHKGKSASMIYRLSQQMREGKRPRIFKYGEQFRDFIHVKDVVLANLLAMEIEESCLINVGTGIPTNFNQIIEILNQILSTSFEPEYFDNPYTSFYQSQTLADTTLSQRLLGFRARFTPQEGIRDYLG